VIEYRARVRRAYEIVSRRRFLLLKNASRRTVKIQAMRFAPGVDARAGFAAREGGEPRGYRCAVVAVAQCADDGLKVFPSGLAGSRNRFKWYKAR
jgi:hypothetical protein